MLRTQSLSSYFPHGAHVNDPVSQQQHLHNSFEKNNDRCDSEEIYSRISNVALLNHGIQFPKNGSVLWDREGLTPPKYVGCKDIIPPIILTKADIRKLLQCLMNPSASFVHEDSPLSSVTDLMGSVLEFGQLPLEHRQALITNPSSILFSRTPGLSEEITNCRGMYGFVLGECSVRGIDTSMTIPLTRITENNCGITDLNFDTKKTQMLKYHLWKALRSGRSFGLRHFLRMRAIGFSSSTLRYAANSSSISTADQINQLRGSVKFEVTVPDISFQFLGIPAIPILATPLCLSLLPSTSTLSGCEDDSLFACFDQKPHMGFVTLNQTRKVVFVLESDANAMSRVPMIGVWLRLPRQSLGHNANGSLQLEKAIDHPLCWAACVRYVFSDKVQERVYIAHETFLLVILVEDSVLFYEVTISNRKILTQPSLSTGAITGMGCELIAFNFTADLSVIEEEGSNSVSQDHFDSLVCRFRPDNSKVSSDSTQLNLSAKEANYIPSKPTRILSAIGNRNGRDESFSQVPPEPRLPPIPITKSSNTQASVESVKDPKSDSIVEYSSLESSYSIPSAGGCYSSMLTLQKDVELAVNPSISKETRAALNSGDLMAEVNEVQQQSLACHSHGVVPGHVLGIQTGPMMYTFPAQIIAAQQRQIELLQRQVEELRLLLVSIGESGNATTNSAVYDLPSILQNLTVNGALSNHSETVKNAQSNKENADKVSINCAVSFHSTSTDQSDLMSFGSIHSRTPKNNVHDMPCQNIMETTLPEATNDGDSALEGCSEDMVNIIESQYLPTNDDREEVLDRLIPNLHDVPMQSIVVSQLQPDVLLRLSDEEVIVSTVTSDEKEFQHNRCVEEASIYDFPTNAISSLSPSKNFQTMISHFGSASRRPTRSALYSQSATLRMAEEEASNFYESEIHVPWVNKRQLWTKICSNR